MTNQEAHLTVSIEQAKLFLLRDVPFDELPKSTRIQDIVTRYRNGTLPGTTAIQYLESFREELTEMIETNNFLINIITDNNL